MKDLSGQLEKFGHSPRNHSEKKKKRKEREMKIKPEIVAESKKCTCLHLYTSKL